MNSTEALAEFAASLRAEQVPDAVLEHAKLDILDTIGCALYGSRLPIAAILERTFHTAADGGGSVPIWGMGWSGRWDTAALVNGTLAHSFELDDLHARGILHPGGTALGALLSIADPAACSGVDVLLAHVAGLEVACRVGLACGPQLLTRGWHNNGILGSFGAACSAGRVIHLDARQMEDAIGTAASLASGLMAAQYGSMVKRMHAGQAAMNGARAALLASNGFTGIKNVLEEEYGGFLATFVDASQPEELAAGLGERWETCNVGFKMYPACGSSHTTISVLEGLKSAHAFEADQVDAVEVHCSTATHKHVGWPYVPDSITTAQMNLPFAAATTILKGTVTVDAYEESNLSEQGVVDLAQRVVTIPEPEIDAGGKDRRHEVWIEVKTKNGEIISGSARDAPGSAKNPVDRQRVIDKFMSLATSAMDQATCERLCDVVVNLEGEADLTALVGTLGGRS